MYYSSIAIVLSLSAVLSTIFVHKVRRYYQIRSSGCKPTARLSTWNPLTGPGSFIDTARLMNSGTLLEESQLRFAQCGKTFETSSLGSLTVHTMEKENLKAVFSTSGWEWGVAPQRKPVRNAIGLGMVTTDGAMWEQSRALMKPLLERANIDHFGDLEPEVQRIFDIIERQSGKVDLQSHLFDLYFNFACEFLFGKVVTDVSPSELELFRSNFNTSVRGAGIRIALGPLAPLLPSRDWQKACKAIQKFVGRYVDEIALLREKSLSRIQNLPQSKMSLLHRIAQKTSDKVVMRDQVLNSIFAVHENVGVLMSNCIFVLARRKDCWAQIKAEVGKLPGEEIDFAALEKMKYMQNFILETLRVYPILFRAPRMALKDTFLPRGGGPDGTERMFIAAGTSVFPYMALVANDPDLWGDDALDFKPQRWEETTIDPLQFAVFGGGTRACLGRRKALMDTSYFLTRVAQEYNQIDPQDEEPYKQLYKISIRNANGCKVIFS